MDKITQAAKEVSLGKIKPNPEFTEYQRRFNLDYNPVFKEADILQIIPQETFCCLHGMPYFTSSWSAVIKDNTGAIYDLPSYQFISI